MIGGNICPKIGAIKCLTTLERVVMGRCYLALLGCNVHKVIEGIHLKRFILSWTVHGMHNGTPSPSLIKKISFQGICPFFLFLGPIEIYQLGKLHDRVNDFPHIWFEFNFLSLYWVLTILLSLYYEFHWKLEFRYFFKKGWT